MDILDKIVKQVEKTIEDGYYRVKKIESNRNSLLEKIKSNRFSLITEIKHRSPVEGKLFNGNVRKLACDMVKGGVIGISIVVEPKFFDGNLEDIPLAKKAVDVPFLMKDFILDSIQINAAEKVGADAVLLISTLFMRGYASLNLDDMISFAHKKGLNVVLEVHSLKEFRNAKSTEADLIGINNRNLRTMEVDVNNTVRILTNEKPDRPIISESGIKTRHDVVLVKNAGAKAALIGTSILKSDDVSKKIQEFLG